VGQERPLLVMARHRPTSRILAGTARRLSVGGFCVERRHEQLRRTSEQQTTRNVALLLNHLGPECRHGVLAFVCVAGPEFIKQGYPGLWYGSTRRVMTPQELLSLISDAARWRETVRASRSSG
jgi:hypothetical protein